MVLSLSLSLSLLLLLLSKVVGSSIAFRSSLCSKCEPSFAWCSFKGHFIIHRGLPHSFTVLALADNHAHVVAGGRRVPFVLSVCLTRSRLLVWTDGPVVFPINTQIYIHVSHIIYFPFLKEGVATLVYTIYSMPTRRRCCCRRILRSLHPRVNKR
jgi:hypothetical protein